MTITINRVLVITPDLNLCTGCMAVPFNPKTGKQYFFDPYRFKDEEEVKKFFEDVRAQLPAEIEFVESVIGSFDIIEEGSRAYKVKVEFNLNN